jgi:hypothetical protein
MRVVRLEPLEERLQDATSKLVLEELANTDNLLQPLAADAKYALVSYRQETSSVDALTLDGDALHGIIEAAKKLGCHAVWLDKWCYRFSGAYNHAHFLSELEEVVSRMQAVVWVPRARAGALGTYCYRTCCANRPQ